MDTIHRVRGEIGFMAGLWLLAAPWLLGYADPFGKAAMASSILGLALVLSAIHDMLASDRISEWANLLIGTLLFVSPLLFAYVHVTLAMLNAVVCGLLVVGSVVWGQERLNVPPS
jgi:hypothetical protein